MSIEDARDLIRMHRTHNPLLLTLTIDTSGLLDHLNTLQLSSQESLDLLRALLKLPQSASETITAGIQALDDSNGLQSPSWNSRQTFAALADLSFALRKTVCESDDAPIDDWIEVLAQGFKSSSPAVSLLSTLFSSLAFKKTHESLESYLLDPFIDCSWSPSSVLAFLEVFIDVLSFISLKYHEKVLKKTLQCLQSVRSHETVGMAKMILQVIEKVNNDEIALQWTDLLYKMTKTSLNLPDVLAVLETMLLHSPKLQMLLVKGFQRLERTLDDSNAFGSGQVALLLVVADTTFAAGDLRQRLFFVLREKCIERMENFSMGRIAVLHNLWKQVLVLPGMDRFFNAVLEYCAFVLESCHSMGWTKSSEFELRVESRRHLLDFGVFLYLQVMKDLTVHRPRTFEHLLSSITESTAVSVDLSQTYAIALQHCVNNGLVSSDDLLDSFQNWLSLASSALEPSVAFTIARTLPALLLSSSFRSFFFIFMRKLVSSSVLSHRLFALESLMALLYMSSTSSRFGSRLNEQIQVEVVDCIQGLMYLSKTIRSNVFRAVSRLSLFSGSQMSPRTVEMLTRIVHNRWERYFTDTVHFKECFRVAGTRYEMMEDFSALSFLYLHLSPQSRSSPIFCDPGRIAQFLSFEKDSKKEGKLSNSNLDGALSLFVVMQLLRSSAMAAFQSDCMDQVLQTLDLLSLLDICLQKESQFSTVKVYEEWSSLTSPLPLEMVQMYLRAVHLFRKGLDEGDLLLSASTVTFCVSGLLQHLNDLEETTQSSVGLECVSNSCKLSFEGFGKKQALPENALEKAIKESVALLNVLETIPAATSKVNTFSVSFLSKSSKTFSQRFHTEIEIWANSTATRSLKLSSLLCLEKSLQMLNKTSESSLLMLRSKFQTQLKPAVLAVSYTKAFVSAFMEGIASDEALAFLGVIDAFWTLSPIEERLRPLQFEIVELLLDLWDFDMRTLMLIKKWTVTLLSIVFEDNSAFLSVSLSLFHKFTNSTIDTEGIPVFLGIPFRKTTEDQKSAPDTQRNALVDAFFSVHIRKVHSFIDVFKILVKNLKPSRSFLSFEFLTEILRDTVEQSIPMLKGTAEATAFARLFLRVNFVKLGPYIRIVSKVIQNVVFVLHQIDQIPQWIGKYPKCAFLSQTKAFTRYQERVDVLMTEFASLVMDMKHLEKDWGSLWLKLERVRQKVITMDNPKVRDLRRVFETQTLLSSKRSKSSKPKKRKKKRKLRSRNAFIDEALLHEEDGSDAYADLEDFIVV